MSFNITFHFYRCNLAVLSAQVKAVRYTSDRAGLCVGSYTSSFVNRLLSLQGRAPQAMPTLGVGVSFEWLQQFTGSARSGPGKSDPDTQWNLQVGDYPACTCHRADFSSSTRSMKEWGRGTDKQNPGCKKPQQLWKRQLLAWAATFLPLQVESQVLFRWNP